MSKTDQSHKQTCKHTHIHYKLTSFVECGAGIVGGSGPTVVEGGGPTAALGRTETLVRGGGASGGASAFGVGKVSAGRGGVCLFMPW